jgi:hypothetical protein
MFGDVDGARHHRQGYATLPVFFDDLIRRSHRSVRCRFSPACPLIYLATIFNKSHDVALILLVYVLTMDAPWDRLAMQALGQRLVGPAGLRAIEIKAQPIAAL